MYIDISYYLYLVFIKLKVKSPPTKYVLLNGGDSMDKKMNISL